MASKRPKECEGCLHRKTCKKTNCKALGVYQKKEIKHGVKELPINYHSGHEDDTFGE
jgi:hypothetical protein